MSERMRNRGRLLLLACGAAASLGLAAAATLYVNADRLDIVEKKRAVAKVITTVDRNAQLAVVAKEGRWYKVAVNGKEGYVSELAVSETPVTAKTRGVSLGKLDGSQPVESETAAAVKGIDPSTQQYASGKSMSTAPFDELLKRRDALTPDEFDAFLSPLDAAPPAANQKKSAK